LIESSMHDRGRFLLLSNFGIYERANYERGISLVGVGMY
jgi:hypothetical protein